MAVRDSSTGRASDTSAGAIIVAAGESRRMAGADKIFVPVLGRPVISYSLKVFHDSPEIDAIVLVLSSDNVDRGRQLLEANSWHKVIDVCVGGDRRQDSVRNGLERLPDVEWVIVHDGARPVIDSDMLATGLVEVRGTGAALAAIPVNDTIKAVDPDGLVQETLDRDRLWSAQTPQVFRRRHLVDAHRRVTEDVTDDAAMIERIGGTARIFMGSRHNIKITTSEDLTVAEAILRSRASGDPQ